MNEDGPFTRGLLSDFLNIEYCPMLKCMCYNVFHIITSNILDFNGAGFSNAKVRSWREIYMSNTYVQKDREESHDHHAILE